MTTTQEPGRLPIVEEQPSVERLRPITARMVAGALAGGIAVSGLTSAVFSNDKIRHTVQIEIAEFFGAPLFDGE